MKTNEILFTTGAVLSFLYIMLYIFAFDIIGSTLGFTFIMFLGIAIGLCIFLGLTLEDKSILITEDKLDNLKSFGRQQDGTYSDWWEFSIVPIKNRDNEIIKWSFCLFDETDGSNIRVKYVTNMNELEEIYKVIKGERLV